MSMRLGIWSEDEQFVYDILGNRITLNPRVGANVVYASNTVNEYTDIGGVTPLLSKAKSRSIGNDCGNLTKDINSYTYHYDNDNRVTKVKKTNDTVDVAIYTYDALGRRFEKDDAVAGSKIRCYYDGQRVLLETDDSDNDERAFVYGNYIDEVLIMTDLSVQGEPDYYYAHDHLYSVVALFVDDDGPPDTIVTERYEYDAYGKVRIMDASYGARTSSSHSNPYYFTGRRRDSLDSNNFKIYYYRARYYDAETGRFLTKDPLGYVDGLNLYEYVRSKPVQLRHPSGLGPTFGPPYFAPPPDPYPVPVEPPYDAPSEECKKLRNKWRLKKLKKASELLGTFLVDVFPLGDGMPHRHCLWNCRMTLRNGVVYAKAMSDLKEELDHLEADYGVAMKEKGCWTWLPDEERRAIGEAARSADQPADRQDNAMGRKCGQMATKRCVTDWMAGPGLRNQPRWGSEADGWHGSGESYCRACCTRHGVGPGTPDGPPHRPWGPRAKQFPYYTDPDSFPLPDNGIVLPGAGDDFPPSPPDLDLSWPVIGHMF